MRMMELKPSGGAVAGRGRPALRRGNPAGPSGAWRGAGVTIITAAPRGQVAMRQVRVRGRIRAAAGLLGPAFVASVAYVDPGNFAANFAGGAEHGYELVWVIMMANLMAILVQYLTAKAGLCTGRSLPELCRERFGRRANVMLWLQAEVVAMATDLAEFTAAAVGINLIFGLPLFPAGLITAIVASWASRRSGDTRRRRYRAKPVNASNCQHPVSSLTSWSATNSPRGLVSTHRHFPGPAKSRASSRRSLIATHPYHPGLSL